MSLCQVYWGQLKVLIKPYYHQSVGHKISRVNLLSKFQLQHHWNGSRLTKFRITGSKLCVKLIINSSACMKYEYYSNLSCGDLSINYAPGFHYLYWILEQVKYEFLDVPVTLPWWSEKASPKKLIKRKPKVYLVKSWTGPTQITLAFPIIKFRRNWTSFLSQTWKWKTIPKIKSNLTIWPRNISSY